MMRISHHTVLSVRYQERKRKGRFLGPKDILTIYWEKGGEVQKGIVGISVWIFFALNEAFCPFAQRLFVLQTPLAVSKSNRPYPRERVACVLAWAIPNRHVNRRMEPSLLLTTSSTPTLLPPSLHALFRTNYVCFIALISDYQRLSV